MDSMKKKIISELDSRISRLEEHEDDNIQSENQYGELNQTLAKVIGVPLKKELEDIRRFVSEL